MAAPYEILWEIFFSIFFFFLSNKCKYMYL